MKVTYNLTRDDLKEAVTAYLARRRGVGIPAVKAADVSFIGYGMKIPADPDGRRYPAFAFPAILSGARVTVDTDAAPCPVSFAKPFPVDSGDDDDLDGDDDDSDLDDSTLDD